MRPTITFAELSADLAELPIRIGRYLLTVQVTDILDIAILVFVLYKILALMRTTRDLAMKIMSKSMKAVKAAKRSINQGLPLTFKDGLLVENDCWTECFREDADGHEGMTAFVEKRPARFNQ